MRCYMKNLKCKYNWNDGTVDLLFLDGTKISLLCKGIEADLNIGIKAQGKLQALKAEKPFEYAVMALNGTMQSYCDTIDRSDHTSQHTLFQQYKERYPDKSEEQIMSFLRESQMFGE